MDPATPPETADLALHLPRDTYWVLVRDLLSGLPASTDDEPGQRATRERAAIAQVACLLPANAAEGALAVDFVAANAHAMDALRAAAQSASDPTRERQCRAQAASMMRQAQSALRCLLRLQAVRQKREADAASADRAAWAEHCTLGLMMDARPAPPSASAAPELATLAEPDPAQAASPSVPVGETACHAQHYPQRAALIRRLGWVPTDGTSGLPDEDPVRGLAGARISSLPVPDKEVAS